MKRAFVESDREKESVPTRQSDTERGTSPSKTQDRSVMSLHRRMGNQAVQRLLQPIIIPSSETSAQVQGERGDAENHTGMPSSLKNSLEHLSGIDLSGVRVHRNSLKPMQLNALAYTQGRDIHVGPGQEKHLPHEGWHAVQQMQGRVNPTIQAKGVSINDDPDLEREADVMGAIASHENREVVTTRESRIIHTAMSTSETKGRAGTMSIDGYPKQTMNNSETVQMQGVETAALVVDISEKVLSSGGGGSDLEITADEMTGMYHGKMGESKQSSNVSTRRAEQFEFLMESVPFREDLIRVKTIMDYEVDEYGIGNISFALVEAHDTGVGWGGRFNFNLTTRGVSDFGEVSLTVSFDVSGWIGSASGSFNYLISVFPHEGSHVYLVRSIGDVGSFYNVNQDHFKAQPS